MISDDFDNFFEIEELISKDSEKKFVNSLKCHLDGFLSKNNNNLVCFGIIAANDSLDKLWNFYHNKTNFNE